MAASAAKRAVSDPNAVYQIDEVRDVLVPFKKVIHLSRVAPLGRASVSAGGSNGLMQRVYRVTYRGDKPLRYGLRSEKMVKKPVDMVVTAGYTERAARALPSRSGVYNRSCEIDMVATGYSPYEGSAVGRCANGMRAGFGLVAVDPRVIPLGTKLYVEGYGYALAGDTGGAIRGRRIDLGQNTHHAAEMVGRRRVHVYILSDAEGR